MQLTPGKKSFIIELGIHETLNMAQVYYRKMLEVVGYQTMNPSASYLKPKPKPAETIEYSCQV